MAASPARTVVTAATTDTRATSSVGLAVSSPEHRRRCAAALLVLLAPSALGHGGAYDPLVVDLHAFLTADGKIDERPPAPGAIAFPASSPAAPAAPLRFTFAAPVAFSAGAAFAVSLQLRADSAVVARDADGNAFEINVEPGGTPVRVAIEPPLLAPGAIVNVSAMVQDDGALHAEGDEIALVVRPLMPLAEGALSLVIGAGSTFDAPLMRVPTPADLRLQDVPHTEFLLESEAFEPPATHAVNAFRVTHEGIEPPQAGAWSADGTYVVLRGEEPEESASLHAYPDRARRVEAAHELRVNGVLARVHPGLGVVVRAPALPLRVECERNCPAGFAWSYAPTSAGPTPTDGPSVLVPPPRDTRGIPVSEDEPEDRSIPGPHLALALALALAFGRPKR